jgi:hypothetical protein
MIDVLRIDKVPREYDTAINPDIRFSHGTQPWARSCYVLLKQGFVVPLEDSTVQRAVPVQACSWTGVAVAVCRIPHIID